MYTYLQLKIHCEAYIYVIFFIIISNCIDDVIDDDKLTMQ